MNYWLRRRLRRKSGLKDWLKLAELWSWSESRRGSSKKNKRDKPLLKGLSITTWRFGSVVSSCKWYKFLLVFQGTIWKREGSRAATWTGASSEREGEERTGRKEESTWGKTETGKIVLYIKASCVLLEALRTFPPYSSNAFHTEM